MHDRNDALIRVATALLGCQAEDLEALAGLWERYDLDFDPDDVFGRGNALSGGAFRAVMGPTLSAAAAYFLEEHGLPAEEPRVEVNNFRDSRVVFLDPGTQALFVAWRAG
jgi:hypothetical protein